MRNEGVPIITRHNTPRLLSSLLQVVLELRVAAADERAAFGLADALADPSRAARLVDADRFGPCEVRA